MYIPGTCLYMCTNDKYTPIQRLTAENLTQKVLVFTLHRAFLALLLALFLAYYYYYGILAQGQVRSGQPSHLMADNDDTSYNFDLFASSKRTLSETTPSLKGNNLAVIDRTNQ